MSYNLVCTERFTDDNDTHTAERGDPETVLPLFAGDVSLCTLWSDHQIVG